ncbi:MAG: phosphatase PAP2 family protein [Rhodobiaceae bacterium]|nr:phosphatase PAP2 family protein [Rhodobiaceae bacterium]
MPKATLALTGFWCALTIAFHSLPGVDIAVSRLFQDSACAARTVQNCPVFPLATNATLAFLRQSMHVLPAVVAVALLGWYAIQFLAGRTLADAKMRAHAVLVLGFAFGPGVFVNGLMKAHMGRPRPHETDLFGGALPFVPAGEYSTYCTSNCSFVSGEASGAFWLLGLLALVPQKSRRAAAWVLVPAALFFSLLRVAFGAHYLSDALLGGLSSIVILSVLALALEQAWRLPRRLLLPRCGL